MKRLLNTATETVHTPRKGHHTETAVCGSLMYVSDTQIQQVSEEELEATDAIDRCGNCFEDAGGY